MASLTFDRPRDADGYRATTARERMGGATMPSFLCGRCGQHRVTRGRKVIGKRWRCAQCAAEIAAQNALSDHGVTLCCPR